MKKLIIGTSVVIATALIAKKLNKKQPGIQVGRIKGMDLNLNLDRNGDALDALRYAIESQRIRRKIESGRIDF